jgi:hypothetical protein
MDKALLLGECSDFAAISTPEISNQYASVKVPEMVDYNFGAPAFVNMKKGHVRIGECPESVTFPSGLIGVNEGSLRQRLFQSFIKGLGFIGKFMVKSHNSSGGNIESTQILKGSLSIVIGSHYHPIGI